MINYATKSRHYPPNRTKTDSVHCCLFFNYPFNRSYFTTSLLILLFCNSPSIGRTLNTIAENNNHKAMGVRFLNKDTFDLFLVEASTDQKRQRAVYTVSSVQEAYDKFMGELKANPEVNQKLKSLTIKSGTVSYDIFK